MAAFVLVHGGWGGGAWWRKLVPLLEAEGHRVFTPDLLGLGEDRTPVADLSLAAWAVSIAGGIYAVGAPVTLVGHGSGGLVISEVAERIPDKIASLVYLAGFLLRDGEALGDVVRGDAHSLAYSNLLIDVVGDTWTLRKEAIRPALFGLCSESDVEFAVDTWRDEPLFSLRTPIHVTPERFGSVERHYIECAQDAAVSLAMQRKMHEAMPCASITTLDSDHSPFFSMPDELARVLHGLGT